jgi:rhamnose utilization protein RhaD (predicted bifunctional aldolase and dehydrogenase)/NAD(P)-dependent dehydrogenase (short-subunit alcohol dehydrogenase family)
MKNRWNDQDAAQFTDDLALRVYTSRLLGQDDSLVLHGGGNTSVKSQLTNLFGDSENVLYVKGSGWDLATIEAPGFAPVRMDALLKMARLDSLSDSEMVKAQRAAMLDPYAPNPSVEAILHALIPAKFVDHTHADAVVTITNSPGGEARIREIYGDSVLIIPYVMPGFILAKKIDELTQGVDWSRYQGMVLLKHGVFSFAEDAKTSYERMIDLVARAAEYLQSQKAFFLPASAGIGQSEGGKSGETQRHEQLDSAHPNLSPAKHETLLQLAQLRRAVSRQFGAALIAVSDRSDSAVEFANLPNVKEIANRGPLTPDHVIRTKPWPLVLPPLTDDSRPSADSGSEASVEAYANNYRAYFQRHDKGTLTCLNPAPCWAVWPGVGTLSFGARLKDATIIRDIVSHTLPAIRAAEKLGAWEALPEADIFAMEYWELEQAKLKKATSAPPLQGKIALVTGAASGIGKACVEVLRAQGAVVGALDLKWPDDKNDNGDVSAILKLSCDVTDSAALKVAVDATVQAFGGLDIVIGNAGTFPPSAKLDAMPEELWDASIGVNLTAHQRLLTACADYLKLGIEPAVVMIASKNVPAPGPGAAAYSVAKAGQTQLARIAALELGEHGVRVNTLHPNAVFDTGIWTEEVLSKRAAHYGLTVEAYKTNNLLKQEVTSRDVAELACAMAGQLFKNTTGAQVPVDGGNERVI